MEDSLLLTRSLDFTLVEATGTSLSFGVMTCPLGKGFTPPRDVATVENSTARPVLTSRALFPTGVAVTLTARKVANKEVRKILICILDKKGS